MAQESIIAKQYTKIDPKQYCSLSKKMTDKEIFEILTKNKKLKRGKGPIGFSVEQFEYENDFCAFYKFIDINGNLVVYYITDDNTLFVVDIDRYEEKEAIMIQLQLQIKDER